MIYCIKRKISGTYLSSVSSSKSKPHVLAFRELANAKKLIHFYKECEGHRPHQEIVIELTSTLAMTRICSNVALNLTIVDEDMHFYLEPDGEYLAVLARAYAKA